MTTPASILGFPDSHRSLAPLTSSSRNRWLLGSYISSDNKLHILDFDEDSNEVSSISFNYPSRVSAISARDSHFAAVSDKSAMIYKVPELDDAGFAADCQGILEEVDHLDGVNGIIWDARSPKLISYSPTAAHLYTLGASKLESISNVSEEGSIMCGEWNIHNGGVGFGIGKGIVEIDIRSMQKAVEINNAHKINVRCIDYNNNRPNYLVSGGDDCVTRIWDTRNSKAPVKEVYDHTHWVWKVAFNKFHDQMLLTCSSDAQVNLQSVVSVSSAPFSVASPSSESKDVDLGEPAVDGLVIAYEQHEESVYSVAWSPADPWIFASLSFDGRVVINQVPQDYKYKILSV